MPEWKSCEQHLTRLKLRNPTDAPITWKALLEVMESTYEYAICRVEWTVAYFKEDHIVSTRRLFMETANVVNRAFRNPAFLETVLKEYQRLTREIIRMM